MPKSGKVVPVVTWFGFPRKRGTQRSAQREADDDLDGEGQVIRLAGELCCPIE